MVCDPTMRLTLFAVAGAFALGCPVSSFGADDESAETRARCATALARSPRRDWSTDVRKLWSPVGSSGRAVQGAIRDDEFTHGPPFREARPFTSAYFVLVHDGAGRPVPNPEASKAQSLVFDFENGWSVASPNERGDLTPYAAKDHPPLAPTPLGWARRLAGAFVPSLLPVPSEGVDRHPVLAVVRSGGVEKNDLHFQFRYALFRLDSGTSPELAQAFCRALGLKDRPALVFRRPMTDDESAQIDHIVDTAYAEIGRLRTSAPPPRSDRYLEFSRRVRELRALRFVEVPPAPGPGLLLEGGDAPDAPESAVLERRSPEYGDRGLGEDGARYAYDTAARRLLEISRAAEGWSLRPIADRFGTAPARRVVSAERMREILPRLAFATDFLSAYLGE